VGVVDASSHPAWAFARAGQSKTTWIVLQVVGFFFCVVGLVLSIVYLASIAPRVRLAEVGAGGPGWSVGPVPGPDRGPPPGLRPGGIRTRTGRVAWAIGTEPAGRATCGSYAWQLAA
jgi:hypothetical protein